MDFRKARKKVFDDFKQLLLGLDPYKKEECENGEHCAFAEGINIGVNPGFANPVNIGVANAPGVAATLVRSDHVHNHPAGLGLNLHHSHYEWIAPPHIIYVDATEPSVANRAFASPRWVCHQARVAKLGLGVQLIQTGNIQLGLYDAAFNQVCVTGAIGVATLTASEVNWFVPSTTPIVAPGMYWVAVVCDTVYSAGVSGLQFNRTTGGLAGLTNWIDDAALGNEEIIRMDGAYPLPDPFVPVNYVDSAFMYTWLRLTSL